MLPTLATMAGINFEPTKVLDGIDISDYILKGTKPEERMVVTDKQRVSWPIKGKNSSVMQGTWRLVNGKELYDVSKDPGQKNNLAEQYSGRVKEMNEFYDTWWESVIAETRYSVIDLGVDPRELITCMDIHSTGQIPNWHQKMIRKGDPLTPAKVMVNFTKAGKYNISLCRWPLESGLAIGSGVNDVVEATAYTDPIKAGKAIKFNKAFVKIDDKEYTIDVDNSKQAATIEVEVEQGAADLTAWLEQADGVLTNAFYIYVEAIN
jgi:hypothetical protein